MLPIILGSAVTADRRGPLALAAGLSLAFVVLGVGVAAIGPAIGIDADAMAKIGASAMIAFGLILLVPAFSAKFAAAAAGVSGHADRRLDALNNAGLSRHFLGGVLLGAAWSPCIGPTLGGAISLAAQGQSLLWSGAVMTSFALGASTVIVLLAYGARETILKRRANLQALAEKSKTVMAIALIGVGLSLYLGLQKHLEALLIEALPVWLQDLSVSL